MKPEMKELYDMNISFIGEINHDIPIDENFMRLWNKSKKIGEGLENGKKKCKGKSDINMPIKRSIL